MFDRDEYWDKWQALLSAAAKLQDAVHGCVLVGGSAVAVHLEHRYSADADHILADLGDRYSEVVDFLEGRDDWKTARLHPPKMILGEFAGVETGLRQLIRSRPLETETLDVHGKRITVPTLEEMLRTKAWMIVYRNATRDFIDFAALARRIGVERAAAVLAGFDGYYEDIYRGPDVSPVLQLAKQLAEPLPHDLANAPPSGYKGVKPPLDDWEAIVGICNEVARYLALNMDSGASPA